jgi:hypothetical protein
MSGNWQSSLRQTRCRLGSQPTTTASDNDTGYHNHFNDDYSRRSGAYPRPFKRLTAQEMVAWSQAGLCFNCDKSFSHGHKCKMLFEITTVNDYDMEEADASLMMMIGRLQSRVQGASPCILRG